VSHIPYFEPFIIFPHSKSTKFLKFLFQRGKMAEIQVPMANIGGGSTSLCASPAKAVGMKSGAGIIRGNSAERNGGGIIASGGSFAGGGLEPSNSSEAANWCVNLEICIKFGWRLIISTY
jgi:hypothetical protein